jgi:molecular chaperone DnaK
MVLGIDLGTTYSVGAYLDENGNPQVITNMEGSQTTPSVVYFENANSVVVGQSAKDNSIINPEDVVSAVKNYMGEKKVYRSTHGQEYTPEVISSFILKKIVSDSEKRLDLKEPIKDVVITIPAYFTDAQRTATEDAAKIAGLNLIGTINEPTAAALYYAVSTKLNHANILIYDLGGGTFDVTIIRVDDDDIVVKSTGGLSKVGGRFFDEDIVEYVRDYIEDKYEIDLEDEEYVDAYQELFGRAEKAKWQLGNQEKATIAVRTVTVRDNVTITREQFEKIVAKLYKRTEYVVKKAIKDAGMEASDLDKVILVGGSSKIPYIENHLSELTGLSPSHEVHPDLVVAQGAALYGKQLTRSSGQTGDKVIHDVCSHSIGIVTIDPVTYKKINSIQIKRNSALPVTVKMPFRTAVANQEKVELSITEGEFTELTDVAIISSTDIILPKGLSKGTKGEILLQLDTSQLVGVYVKIPSADYEEKFTFERSANLSEDEVEMLTGIIADYDVN